MELTTLDIIIRLVVAVLLGGLVGVVLSTLRDNPEYLLLELGVWPPGAVRPVE